MNKNEDLVKVYLVNPPLNDPWRKRKDYDEEQREARERHEMYIVQHKVILRSHRATIVACIFSGIAALATCAIVYLTYQQ